MTNRGFYHQSRYILHFQKGNHILSTIQHILLLKTGKWVHLEKARKFSRLYISFDLSDENSKSQVDEKEEINKESYKHKTPRCTTNTNKSHLCYMRNNLNSKERKITVPTIRVDKVSNFREGRDNISVTQVTSSPDIKGCNDSLVRQHHNFGVYLEARDNLSQRHNDLD